MVKMVGRNHSPLRGRASFSDLPCDAPNLRLCRRSGMFVLVKDAADGAASAPHPVAQFDRRFGACRKQDVDPRPKTNEPDKLALVHHVADPFPEYYAARDYSGDLRKNQFDPAVTDHDDVALVIGAG